MQRIGILNGNNITQDKDLSSYFSPFAVTGVIEGLAVTANSVSAGKGIIEGLRTNGEKVAIAYENTEAVVIDTSGTTKVFIEVKQAKLDDGSLNAEDGTGVAVITTNASYPSGNYIKLASVTTGAITDERESSTIKARNIAGNVALMKATADGTFEVQKANKTLGKINALDFLLSGAGTNTANGLLQLNGSSKVDPAFLDALPVETTNTNLIAGENLTAGNTLRNGSSEDVIDTDHKTGSTWNGLQDNIGYSTTYYSAGQSYQATVTTTSIKKITVSLLKTGSPSFNMTCKVYSNTSGTLVASSTNTISATSVTSSYADYEFTFSSGSLIAGVTYYFLIEPSTTGNSSNYIRFASSTDGSYSLGRTYYITNTGSWNIGSSADWDRNFKIEVANTEDVSKVYKTDASNSNKIKFIGYANETVNINNAVNVNTAGVDSNQSGKTPGVIQYLSNTPGGTSETPGTNTVKVSIAISTTKVKIFSQIVSKDWELVGDIDYSGEGSKTLGVTGGSYMFKCEYALDLSGASYVQMRLNADSSSNYTYRNTAGSQISNQTQVIITQDGGYSIGTVYLSGKTVGVQHNYSHVGGNYLENVQAGRLYRGVDENLTSITFFPDTGTFTGKVKIYRKAM